MPQAFEQEFEKTFPHLRANQGIHLFRLYPEVRPTGLRGKCPVFTMAGQAMFDVAGWIGGSGRANVPPDRLGRFIGVELKETGDYHPSLRIVGADQQASGLQYHQLEAAYVVWRNGGMVGRLDGDAIASAFWDYGVSLAAEEAGKKFARGSRSIPWAMFKLIRDPELQDWFPKEVLLAAR